MSKRSGKKNGINISKKQLENAICRVKTGNSEIKRLQKRICK